MTDNIEMFAAIVVEWLSMVYRSTVLRPTRHIIGHLGDGE